MSELKLQQCQLDGRYDILDCLGRGSYAEIYMARDTLAATSGTAAPQMVVIKALNTFLQGVPDVELERTLIENFRNEAVALDRVRHPNIISRLGHGTAIDLSARTFHYLVLEYLPGGDLAALCRNHPLTLERALFFFEQVSAGLEYAHECGVIHRDIKPHNLLLTADHQTVKIADFGVAKIEATEGAITRVGTDLYAAPEHHPLAITGPLDTASLTRPRAHLTPAADVYSLAKTTYMLLTGEAPRHLSLKPISELPASVADKPWAAYVLRVLHRATQSIPTERYQTVGEFWSDLRDAALPQTRPLTRSADDLPPSLPHSRAAREAAKIPSPAPPPVAFEPTPPSLQTQGEARPRLLQRPRIVVPISVNAPLERATDRSETAERGTEAAPAAQLTSPSAAAAHYTSEARDSSTRLSGRTRRWLVAILLIAAFTGMLLATHKYVSRLRAGPAGAKPSASSVSPLGREFLAITDVNLRQGPNRGAPKVGMAERGSPVRVVDTYGSWYKVDVLEHKRPKEDPASSDQGWLDKDFLKAK